MSVENDEKSKKELGRIKKDSSELLLIPFKGIYIQKQASLQIHKHTLQTLKQRVSGLPYRNL